MKKSTSHDAQGISDLLKKLQDAYLGGGKKSEKQRKKEQADEADRKFQEQLAKMLAYIICAEELNFGLAVIRGVQRDLIRRRRDADGYQLQSEIHDAAGKLNDQAVLIVVNDCGNHVTSLLM